MRCPRVFIRHLANSRVLIPSAKGGTAGFLQEPIAFWTQQPPGGSLADVNTQTAVPELPANVPVNSPVNLPDVGDLMSDSQPVQSASDGMSKSFVPRRVSRRARNTSNYLKDYLCWLDLQVLSLVRLWANRRPYLHYITGKKWNIWKVQWKQSYLTFLFAGNDLVLTTNTYCDFNAALIFSLMDEKWYKLCPKLKLNNRIYRNVSIFNTSTKISHSFQGFHRDIVNLLEFGVSCNTLLSSPKFAIGRPISIWELKQSGRKEWCKVQYLAIWYPIENLLYMYKLCLMTVRDTLF